MMIYNIITNYFKEWDAEFRELQIRKVDFRSILFVMMGDVNKHLDNIMTIIVCM